MMLDVFSNGQSLHHLEEYNNKSNEGASSISYNRAKFLNNAPSICEGCCSPITDRYVMKVENTKWHETCLSCARCGEQLVQSCYYRNRKFYCKLDYTRLFGIKCTSCGESILPEDMVMRAKEFVYHLPCFKCIGCSQLLKKGEEFILNNGRLLCKPDYDKQAYTLQNILSPEIEIRRSRDGRHGPKRPRTILTSQQRKQFKAAFDVSPKPCRKVREALARNTGLSARVVQVWFQNQRAKMKKMERKGNVKNDANKIFANPDADNNNTPDHGDKYLNLDNQSDSEDASYNTDNNPIDPNHPYSPDDDDEYVVEDQSIETPSSNDDSIMDDVTSNIGTEIGCSSQDELLDLSRPSTSSDDPALRFGSQSHHNQTTHAGQINPIDKLYLMQNSYFNTNP